MNKLAQYLENRLKIDGLQKILAGQIAELITENARLRKALKKDCWPRPKVNPGRTGP